MATNEVEAIKRAAESGDATKVLSAHADYVRKMEANGQTAKSLRDLGITVE